ncbi:glycosyltransferase involved in cell wall biosynthesis [Clostridium moniliforme]|uniref:Glycosyltransferase involved in cell wall biosynthesis n=1 Tax=Clostridium moniliforme TaxID=39489 RepID=A0ABS4EZ71_9CLOT|nr:glycosyltransferase family 4 protein [Clostridium moniliforme]MBP1889142.1 glycosyltransferase involved in cell wall biosynthesis [Clostridium moniliforme]
MKKICFIISGIAYSGAEIVLNRYIKDNLDIEPIFIIIYKDKNVKNKFIEEYGSNRVFSLNINYNKNLIRFMPDYISKEVNEKITPIICKVNPDIIYCNNTVEAMLMNKYIKKNSLKSIAHIHDMKRNFKSIITRNFISKSLNEYDVVINVSKANKESWGIKKSVVVYNGLDKEYLKKDKKINGINNIGFVGSLIKRKGIDLILNSIPSLVKLGFNVHIAYSSYDYKYYKKLNELRKIYTNNIIIYENLKPDEIKKIYDKIDLLIVPSRQDPLPTVVIEAMARGTIVIGNNIDGIPEMINNKEMLFEKKGLIDKIIDISSRDLKELSKLSVGEIEIVESKFSNENKKNLINNIINGM